MKTIKSNRIEGKRCRGVFWDLNERFWKGWRFVFDRKKKKMNKKRRKEREKEYFIEMKS